MTGKGRDLVYVAVCGGDPAPPEDLSTAEEVGRLLAREGAVIVCGGRGGVMEAAARGASEGGGVSIGIVAGERSDANGYLTYALGTGMGEMRNVLVVRSADAVIAVGGEFGTLSEIAFALKTGVPVVGLRTWELAKRGSRVDAFVSAETPEDAVREALRLARGRR